MIKPVLVRDIMVKEPFTLSADTPIVAATRSLLDKHYSGAAVVDEDGRLIGTLSKRDCLEAALNAHYHHDWTGMVSDYMALEVETMDANAELTTAAVRFIKSSYRRFPVTDNDVLIGQVSRTDVLRALFGEDS